MPITDLPELDLTSSNAPNPELVHQKIEELSNALKSAHPSMPILLRTIHSQILKDANIVTLLSAEEIGTIVSGLQIQTNTTISAKVITSKKSTSKLSADDL